MGVALCIVAQEPVAGLDLCVRCKALGNVAEQTIDQLCDALKVTSLVSFTSQNPEEIADLMGEDVIDVDDADEFPGEEWFAPEDGLTTIRALIAHLTNVPSALPDAATVVDDLRGFERILVALAENQVKWYLAVDF